MSDRYNAHGSESQFEPGSRRRVLRNLLGITSAREMNEAESHALVVVTRGLLAEDRKGDYFAAIQSGLDKNYQPMAELFAEVIERSAASY